MPVNIHGKSYATVAERITIAGEDLIKVNTEVLFTDPVVIKATIRTTKGTFTGISAANPSKALEKESPWEIAETSAVGRALAFAGYETTNGIASAEEMQKVEKDELFKEVIKEYDKDEKICTTCGQPMVYRTGVNKSSGKEWKGYFCPNKDSNPIFIH